MVPFLGGCNALKGVLWAVEKTETEKLDFSAHLRRLKGYLAFTDFIKNQSHRCSLGYSRYPSLEFLNISPIGRWLGR